MHEGHRQRMIARYRAEGLDHFADHEVLELLLFSQFSRQDVNELAHRLVRRFGSFSAVLQAGEEDLLTVKGVTPRLAQNLALYKHLFRIYEINRFGSRPVLQSYRQAGQYARALLEGYDTECIYCILMNARSAVIASERVAEGTVASAPLQPRKVLEAAIRHKAYAVILAHNHPGGNPRPSISDRQLTRNLQYILSGAEVRLLDHLIVSDTRLFSFANQRLMQEDSGESGACIAQNKISYDIGASPEAIEEV
ncbi:MAG: JAB domain-containing protein [Christensenellales bacterium]|jgi:DNA repair protein RadC